MLMYYANSNMDALKRTIKTHQLLKKIVGKTVDDAIKITKGDNPDYSVRVILKEGEVVYEPTEEYRFNRFNVVVKNGKIVSDDICTASKVKYECHFG